MTNDDYISFVNRVKNSAPDGVFDATSYISRIEDIANRLSNIYDIQSEESRLLSMLNLSEICFSGEEGVLAVCYLLTLLLSSLDDLVDGSYENFVTSLQEDVLPMLKENQSSVPYWM